MILCLYAIKFVTNRSVQLKSSSVKFYKIYKTTHCLAVATSFIEKETMTQLFSSKLC